MLSFFCEPVSGLFLFVTSRVGSYLLLLRCSAYVKWRVCMRLDSGARRRQMSSSEWRSVEGQLGAWVGVGGAWPVGIAGHIFLASQCWKKIPTAILRRRETFPRSEVTEPGETVIFSLSWGLAPGRSSCRIACFGPSQHRNDDGGLQEIGLTGRAMGMERKAGERKVEKGRGIEEEDIYMDTPIQVRRLSEKNHRTHARAVAPAWSSSNRGANMNPFLSSQIYICCTEYNKKV